MENEEGEGGFAAGCGGGAGKPGAHGQTDLAAAEERLFEDMRLVATQHAVILGCFCNGLRSCD